MTHMSTMKTIAVLAALALGACSSRDKASAAGDVASAGERDLTRQIAQSDVATAAQSSIDRGHPWQGTQLLAPVLKDPAKRTPVVVIVAARAAAGWDGWPEVEKILAKETWLDSLFDGEGRELLVRASLERGGDTAAVTLGRRALADAKTAQQRAVRSVYLARAFERSNYFDSAVVAYTRAGETLRSVRDWLVLRAAGTQPDSTARARSFALVKSPVARARIPWTDAQARERSQDALGAAARYASLGSVVPSLRLRLSVAPDSATRLTIKNELLSFIRTHAGTGDAKSAVEVLDKGFTSLAPNEELIIARSSAASGPVPRAVVAFERALSQPNLITANDRLSYAQALVKANRSRDALSQLALITGPLAGQAAYQRARVFLTTGTADQTKAALRDVISKFPSDSGAASAALYLLADLSTDAGDDAAARSMYQQLYRSYPGTARAPEARFDAAIITLVQGDSKSAARQLDSVVALYPRAEDAAAARYWAGRAYAQAGDDSTARTRWRESTGLNVSYYNTLASKRLGEAAWVPPARADSFLAYADLDSAFARIALLEKLGMDVEQRFELDALDEAAGTSPDRIAATAHAFLAHDQSSRAIRLAQKLIDAGQRDARAYRLLYPMIDRDELAKASKANGLDPWLVAGLIRQESNFNPRAVSAANARGLMQVLPSVGEEVSRALRYPVWYPALLLDADANLQLGTAHLASYMKQYGPLPRVLAAYNAGGSRVTRWSTKSGMDDGEMFAERIPFTETRDYVRIVQRNAAVYRALYTW